MRPFTALLLLPLSLPMPLLSAQVVYASPTAAKLIAADARLEPLATDRKFLEGPVWLPREQALVCSDIPPGKLLRWTAKTGVQEWKDVANANGTPSTATGACCPANTAIATSCATRRTAS